MNALLPYVLAVALVTAPAGDDAATDEEPIDYLQVAAVLLRDGHVDRAAATLDEADPSVEGFDAPRYYTLRGLVELRRGAHLKAIEPLEKALTFENAAPVVWVFLAQARFGISDWTGTLEALDRAGEAAAALPGSWLIRAQCHWRLGDRIAAWRALEAGGSLHPDEPEMRRQRLMLLIDLGLYQQALIEARSFLESAAVDPNDHVAVAEALRHSKAFGTAAALLDEARLKHPNHEGITRALGRVYLESGRPLAAAAIFEQAARRFPKLMVEAAELYRRAGRPVRALYANEQIGDQKAKIRQRLALLVEAERYEEAAELEPRLLRLGLLEDDELIYALAYACFMTTRFEDAERWLGQVTDAAVFERALMLRKAMAQCREEGWSCTF